MSFLKDSWNQLNLDLLKTSSTFSKDPGTSSRAISDSSKTSGTSPEYLLKDPMEWLQYPWKLLKNLLKDYCHPMQTWYLLKEFTVPLKVNIYLLKKDLIEEVPWLLEEEVS